MNYGVFGTNNSLLVAIWTLCFYFGLMTSGFDAFSPRFNNLDGIVMTTSLVCFPVRVATCEFDVRSDVFECLVGFEFI